MKRAAFAIGVDVGSSNVKVVAVRADGRVLARRRRTLSTDDRPPVCEQDAEAICDAVVEGSPGCVAEAIERAGQGASSCAVEPPAVAIGVASQYSSTVPVHSDGSPAGRVQMWRDRRGTAPAASCSQRPACSSCGWSATAFPRPAVG